MAKPLYQLLRPETLNILLDLGNPRKSVRRELSEGRAAGKLDLIYALFPPRDMHRNSVPARYTFVVEAWVDFEIQVMVSLTEQTEPDMLVFGFIAHDQSSQMREESGIQVPAELHFVAVQYCPVTRKGSVFLYKEVFEMVKAIKKADLDGMRRIKERRKAGTEYALPGG